MKKLVLFMHVALDGFVAGPKGEMDWIKVNDEIFDYAHDASSLRKNTIIARHEY